MKEEKHENTKSYTTPSTMHKNKSSKESKLTNSIV